MKTRFALSQRKYTNCRQVAFFEKGEAGKHTMATNSGSSSSSILAAVQHYQRSIERSQNDETKLIHCIGKLYKLQVTVEHLQETGIGKTVNSLRKYSGEIGVAAKALVTKWKAMVAAEEEPVDTYCQNNEDDTNNSHDKGSSDEDHQFDKNRNSAVGGKESHASNKTHKTTERHSSKERSRHKQREGKDSGGSSSSSRHGLQHEKASHDENVLKQKRDSSQSHTEHRTEQMERELGRHSEHGKHKERHEKRKPEKVHEVDEDKEKTISASSSHHKRKREESEHHHGSKERSGHDKTSKHRGSERSSHSTSSKEKSKQEQHSKSKDVPQEKPEKDKSSSKEKEQRGTKSTSASSLSSPKPSTSNSVVASERKRNADADAADNTDDIKYPTAKLARIQTVTKKSNKKEVPAEADADNGIDSSMGANFADVLGMLNMPTKKSKKSSSNLKSPVSTGGASKSGSSSKETSYSKTPNTSKVVNGIKSSTSAAASAATSKASTSQRSPDTKPELLYSSAKLEPLDPSIALELPTISNNYKPLPLNQTVMDCVFNTATSSSSKVPPMRTLTDAEALSHGISSKTMRTKIYSGVRSGQIHQVPSLFDLCIRVLQKNIDALEYTGGVPFEVLRPVLERATPHQLLTFEEYNPYLMEDSDVLWQLHVQRNYRTQKRQEMESWREMYLRCQDDQERKLNILAESIKQSQKIIAAPVRKTQMAFVDSMVKPPRNVLRKQEQFGTKGKLIATPAARVAALSNVTPNAAKPGDVRLRVAAGVRDAAQVSHASVRPKKAPLMAKTLQFMRGRHKR